MSNSIAAIVEEIRKLQLASAIAAATQSVPRHDSAKAQADRMEAALLDSIRTSERSQRRDALAKAIVRAVELGVDPSPLEQLAVLRADASSAERTASQQTAIATVKLMMQREIERNPSRHERQGEPSAAAVPP